jgi:hypothetical protein
VPLKLENIRKELSGDKLKEFDAKIERSLITPGERLALLLLRVWRAGTQMFMRTHHSLASEELDVTLGLPRLIEFWMPGSAGQPSMTVYLQDDVKNDEIG